MPGASGARNTTRRTASLNGAGALRLVVLGEDAVPTFPLDAPNLLVGRSPDNDIVLGEASVSARHARIDLRDGLIFLTDLGSTNGTFVAGRRVTGSVELQPGDTVALGRCQVRVEGAAPPVPPEPRRAGRPRDPDSSPAPDSSLGTTALPTPIPGPLPPSEWLKALQRASEVPIAVPAAAPLRVLISFDPAASVDAAAARMLAGWLTRLWHQVRTPPGTPGRNAGRAVEVDGLADPWAGRLLEVMWSTDVVVFVVSDAVAGSPRVHREVHLAGAERTPVVPVLVSPEAPDGLPDDLAYYLQVVAPIGLQLDPAAGLAVLAARLEGCRPKRVARPWRLARRITAVAVMVLVVGLVLAFLVL